MRKIITADKELLAAIAEFEADKPDAESLLDVGVDRLRLKLWRDKKTGQVRNVWEFTYRHGCPAPGKKNNKRVMGIGGGYPAVPLKLARERAREANHLLDVERVDPIERAEQLKKAEAAKRIAEAEAKTYRDVVEDRIKFMKAGRKRHKKNDDQVFHLLRRPYPKFGDRLIDDITRPMIVDFLLDIRNKVSLDRAERARMNLRSFFDWAINNDYRKAAKNPAPLKEDLDWPEHQKKLYRRAPLDEIPGMMQKLIEHDSDWQSRALRLVILNGSRTNEILTSKVSDFDLTNATWQGIENVHFAKGQRKKMRYDNPLTAHSLEIIKKQIAGKRPSDPLFPQINQKKESFTQLTDYKNKLWPDNKFTIHGFRGVFGTWLDFNEIRLGRFQLGHAVDDRQDFNKVDKSYHDRRFVEERRAVMERWEAVCMGTRPATPAADNVIKFFPRQAS